MTFAEELERLKEIIRKLSPSTRAAIALGAAHRIAFGRAAKLEEERRTMGLRNCGKCHDCGQPVRIVLDGEEWCDRCHQYQRPRSHGWAASGDSECPQRERDLVD